MIRLPVSALEAHHVNGGLDVRHTAPTCATLNDALYLPCGPQIYSGGWGLYGVDMAAAPLSIPLRGDAERPFGHLDHTRPTGSVNVAGRYFYLGQLETHYGHMLIEGLARTWCVGSTGPFDGFVYHGMLPPDALLLKCPFLLPLLHGLGITPVRLLRPTIPTQFAEIVIPEPAMQARSHIYRKLISTYDRIRDRLPVPVLPATDGPLYLSKTRLSSGVTHITNEQAIEDALRAVGATIFYPERSDLLTQIAILERHQNVISTAGSALHTMLLCRGNQTVRVICPTIVNSNYPLIDLAKGLRSEYFFTPANTLPPTTEFMFRSTVTDVAALVDGLLDW